MLPIVVCLLSFPSKAAYPFRKANVSLWFVLRDGSGKGPSCVRRSPFLPPKPAEDYRLPRPWPLDIPLSLTFIQDALADRWFTRRRVLQAEEEQWLSSLPCRKSTALHSPSWRDSMNISSVGPRHAELWLELVVMVCARLRWLSPDFRVSSALKVLVCSWEKTGNTVHTF